MIKKIIVGLVVVVVVGIASFLLFIRHTSIIPTTIQKQVKFAIFYPTTKSAKIDKTTFQYDTSIKSVSFVVDFAGRKITFAEQSTPDTFADIPSYYPMFAEKLNNYATFDTINGRVDLTRPTKVNSQTGLMNSKGTLVFAKSDGDISEDSWKQLFNSLSFTKPY